LSVKNAFIHVAAAAIINENGEVLVSQRKQGSHLGGYWEFPGGKVEPGEKIEAALSRELKEELDILPLSSRPLIRTRHCYPDKSVLLDVWRVESYSGRPLGAEGQNIAWRDTRELDPDEFPPADGPIIHALLLPNRYLITGEFSGAADFQQRLSTALKDGIELVQLRLTHDWTAKQARSDVHEIVDMCTDLCQHYGARLLLNLPEQYSSLITAGVHLSSKRLLMTTHRPAHTLVSASCHNREQLEHAQTIGADFAALSPVQRTRSHPDAVPLGWEAFRQLVDESDIPVYALGGMTEADMEQAWNAGAQGIAAIGAFWDGIQADS
jgi:8-oxo-dGTP diphosphatase